MEDVFFIIGSSKGQGKEIFELLKPESVEIIQFDSFDDLTESSYKLSPTFVLVDRSFDIKCLKKGINSENVTYNLTNKIIIIYYPINETNISYSPCY